MSGMDPSTMVYHLSVKAYSANYVPQKLNLNWKRPFKVVERNESRLARKVEWKGTPIYGVPII